MLAFVIVAAYSNALRTGFHFDDWHVIEQNPHIRSLSTIPRFFVDPDTTTILHENKDLRPLLMTTFAINYAISGYNTWSYHVFNWLLHWLVALLIFRIVRDHCWLGDAAVPVATVAALVVAVHPLNTEPVNYISARSALLTTAFYLGAFDAAVRGRRLACLGLFSCALLTKTIAITLPLVVLVHAWMARTQQPHDTHAQPPWRFIATLVALAAASVAYRLALLPPWALQTTHRAEVTPWIYFTTEWSAYLYYLRLFVWPNALVIDRGDYPLVTSLWQPQAWASLLALMVLAGLAWAALRRWPALTFAAAWYAITLATESTFFPLAEPVNEHRPYLAMLGLGAITGVAVYQLATMAARGDRQVRRATFAAILTVITVGLAAATYGRNRTWRDDYTLWRDAADKAPRNARAWLNLGHAAMARNQDVEAETFLLRARQLSPCYTYVALNLSALAAKTGSLSDSLRWADEAVRCNPQFALAHFYRGTALQRLGRLGEASDAYQRATTIDTQMTNAWFAQGVLREQRGDWAGAADAFDLALVANPTNADAAMRAGLIYHHRLANPARAIDHYRTVLRLVPTHYGAHFQIATALLDANRLSEARAAWREFVPLAQAIGDKASLDAAPTALRVGSLQASR